MSFLKKLQKNYNIIISDNELEKFFKEYPEMKEFLIKVLDKLNKLFDNNLCFELEYFSDPDNYSEFPVLIVNTKNGIYPNDFTETLLKIHRETLEELNLLNCEADFLIDTNFLKC